MKNYGCKSGREGFSLIEVLVVIAIIGLLVALLLPAVQAARESARRSQCLNNLKQHGVALNTYSTSVDAFPIGYIFWPKSSGVAPGWAWSTAILPQLEQGPIYSAININVPIDLPANITARTSALSIYVCPSDRKTGVFTRTSQLAGGPIDVTTISYAASQGVSNSGTGVGMFQPNKSTRPRDLKDGASNTIALGERPSFVVQNAWVGALSDGQGGEQVLASSLDPSAASSSAFSGPHSGVVQFLMADGSARPIKMTINPKVFQALTTRSGREVIDQNAY